MLGFAVCFLLCAVLTVVFAYRVGSPYAYANLYALSFFASSAALSLVMLVWNGRRLIKRKDAGGQHR